MEKMKLKNQILLVNGAILAGLVFQYFRGYPVLPILITGILLMAMANLIFFVRVQKAKNLR